MYGLILESNNVRKYPYLLAVAVLVVVIFASGCTSQQNQTSTKTYAAGGMSFEYPESWNVTSKISANDSVVTLSDATFDRTNGTQGDAAILLRTVKTNNVTSESLKEGILKNLKQTNGNGTSTTLNVGSVTANETTYNTTISNTTAQIKIVNFESNNFLYIIMFATINQDAQSQQSYYNTIIKSFKPQ